ncbi:MAG: ABC transporter ATP-binding protein, partial [bacterium]
RQRVALARGLIFDPNILLMDEPFASLDELTRTEMNQELLRIIEASDKTVVFVTHHIPEAVFLSDRILVMSHRPGRILEDVAIDLPRPRTLGVRHTQQFQDYAKALERHFHPD